ncbi:DUF6233 domain-containing protein [Streptomyces lycii]|uniref:DUF6233 domain-containing protein n=1 Tax=Streptomyces lycii TaxID=2654337 RepID=UPI0012E196EB|nr:DUF6233 domain-containing protein [Streptomyces lycii]
MPSSGSGPVWVLHRPDCWTGRSHSDLIDTEQARRRLHAGGDARAEPCDVCRPETALRH